MPNIEDWEFRGQTGGNPRIVFGGQGDWLPTNASGSGRASVEMRRGGAWIARRNTDTRGFESGRIRAWLYIGPDAAADVVTSAYLELRCYVQAQTLTEGGEPNGRGEGGFIAAIRQYSDRYEAQLIGEDVSRAREQITDLEETTLSTALTSGDFIGWELRWESSADPAINPNPTVTLSLNYYLTDDWLTPNKIQLACVDYGSPIWESFFSPIVWGQFNQAGIFLGIATPLWEGGALKGFQV